MYVAFCGMRTLKTMISMIYLENQATYIHEKHELLYGVVQIKDGTQASLLLSTDMD